MIFPALISLFGAYLLMDKDKTYAKGGSTLLAPNGKRSNLTPEQWKLVRTPEFKAWFGDWEKDPENASKVVDENGEPLVCYHQSDSEKIDIFKPKNNEKEVNKFFFFSTREQSFLERKYTYKFFLAPNNTFSTHTEKSIITDEYGDEIGLYNIKRIDNKKIDELKKIVKKNEIKIIEEWKNKNTDSIEDVIEHLISLKKPFDYTSAIIEYITNWADSWSVLEQDIFINFIVKNGYDSFITKEEGITNIALKNPYQIKLADGSNTTFDAENPDIRYDDGGDTRIYYDNAYYASPLSDLIKFAKKFNDYKEFENWYSIGLNHGYYWHLTDNKNFQISDNISPRDMSSMSSGNNTSNFGDLMITGDLEYWDNYYNINPQTGKKDIKRKYVVLFDATELNPKSLKQVSRGFGNEIYLNKEDAKKLIIKGVYSRHHAKHLNNRFQEILPQSEQDLYKLWEYAHKKKNDWTEFYEDLKIEDGSKYIGMKFYEIFPFLKRSRSTPYTFKLWVKSYKGILSRLEKDKYSVKKEKQRDLNKINKYPYNNIDIMEKWKYLSNFYLDATGTIMSYKDEKL